MFFKKILPIKTLNNNELMMLIQKSEDGFFIDYLKTEYSEDVNN